MPQVIYNGHNSSNEKTIEIQRDEKPRDTYTLEEAVDKARKFVVRLTLSVLIFQIYIIIRSFHFSCRFFF